MKKSVKPSILEAAKEKAEKLGLELVFNAKAMPRQFPQPDAWVKLSGKGLDVNLPALTRKQVSPETLGVLHQQLNQWEPHGILILDQATPSLAELLKGKGIFFLDGAGNAFLEGPATLIWVKGERNSKNIDQNEPTGRAFQPKGLQVLFALLCKPDLINQPYRDIATLAGVAHGTVGSVLAELQTLGFMGEVKGQRRLVKTELLLSQWVEAYARVLRPKLFLGRYHADDLEKAVEAGHHRPDLLLGGEMASTHRNGYLKAETATFYASEIDNRLIALGKLRKDATGNVEFRRKFWNFESDLIGQVPLILIYADLLAMGNGRCMEAASMILPEILKGIHAGSDS